MKNFTVLDILKMRPCEGYGKDRVKELWAGRESLTSFEILDLDIPIEDRFWVVLRYEVLGETVCDIIACDIAEHVLSIFEKEYPDDKRPRRAIETARRHITGEVNDAARAAAGDAALAAMWAAAGDAEQRWQLERVRAILDEKEGE